MNIDTVNELIQSLASAGELSIKERKYLELAKAYADKEAESVAQALTFEKCRELSGCPAGVDLQDWVKQLAAENAGLKDCVVKHYPAVEHWNSWADAEDKIQSALDTPASDRIVAGIKADGVEELAKRRRAAAKVALDEFNDVKNHAELESEAWRAEMFAAELREGAK
ncbi:TPA: hypothetical protein N3288_003363 [Klebsiella aerogenes]|nr:hypothetical protein [Klebsiella aerogenes]